MGLSYEEACRIGIGHEHPEHPSRRDERPPPPVVAVTLATSEPKPSRPRTPTTNALGQNKTEARFDAMLADSLRRDEIRWFAFEPITLRLAGRTSYRPDFLIQRLDFTLAAVEVKGFMRDDAAVKIKVAAAQHPWMDFYLAVWDRHYFAVRAVTAKSGIERNDRGGWWRPKCLGGSTWGHY